MTVFLLLLLAAMTVMALFLHYRDDLKAEVISTLREKYGMDLKTSDFKVSLLSNWPQVAVRLEDVSATTDKLPGSSIQAESIGFSFNIRELLQKKFLVQSLAVNHGTIHIIRPPDSTRSENLQQIHPDNAHDLEFSIARIVFRNIRFRYQSPGPGQDLQFDLLHNTLRIKKYSNGLRMSMNGKINIQSLAFRKNRGTFFDSSMAKIDLHATWLNERKSLCIEPGSAIQLNNHKYDVTALVAFGEDKNIELIASTNQVMLHQIRKIMNERINKILTNYEVSGPIDCKLILKSAIGKQQEPALIVTASTDKNKVYIGTSKVPYHQLSFNGKIVSVDKTGTRGDITRARVTFERVSGKIYDYPFTAAVSVKNLRKPYVTIMGKMNIDATKINLDLRNEFDLGGKAQAFITYAGPASKINRKHFLDKEMKLQAELRLMNLSYKEKIRPYIYTLNGKAHVQKTHISFKNLHVNTVAGNARLNGNIRNFVNFVLGYTKGFRADLVAYSDSLNLNPVLMRKDTSKKDTKLITYTGHEEVVQETPHTDSVQHKLNTLLEKHSNFSTFEFDVKLNAKKFLLRRVYAEDAKISLNYKNEVLDVQSLKLNTCEGRIKAVGRIDNFERLSADISVEDVDVNMMFTQFENFGQNAISSENIRGKIYLDAKFNSQLDENLEILGETMTGEVRLSVREGQLLNFEPLQKLSNFLFKNRDFNNISFSELNESFQVRGYEMKIDEFEIGSSVLNLYVVNGIYNFKGQSNINLLVPWSNLKKRGKNYIPRTSGMSADSTKGVKLNFSGPANKMKISLGHKEITVLKPSI